ncbi:aurachin C monooxygenase/isomerase-like [Bradysia coprophila]|uniref:aurachin C monooxygenase/isomerase-like n=1 Tax=Bradysia coprophila TaxID=38358 RepID=UPI00187DB64C|nr:aurachin C monooxygenase/isomerase-like [Bradysia coprophila]
MPTVKVIIIGCGIAGPVIALLLKRKGYEPVILEKVKELGDAGASLMMCPNGLKVLSLLEIGRCITESATHLEVLCESNFGGDVLGVSDLPSKYPQKYGQPAFGVKRTTLNLALKDALKADNIKVHEGWKLKDIMENEDSVTAVSETGEKVVGSFLIGCDGIKAISRLVILKKHGAEEEEASYTGLTQTAGMSPTPLSVNSPRTMLNIYGPGAHFICYPVSPTTTSWAITQRNRNASHETWKLFSPSELNANRSQLLDTFKDWCSPVPELIGQADRIIKYGLYDRPQLESYQWYSIGGRCVLVGDAAHPTSPHLGQGANQALEDCYHLSRVLPDVADGDRMSTDVLRKAFETFARSRQPRTAALVKGARAQGELRVCDGDVDACTERDSVIRNRWKNVVAVEANFDSLYKEPF